jgi:hypothetical protein
LFPESLCACVGEKNRCVQRLVTLGPRLVDPSNAVGSDGTSLSIAKNIGWSDLYSSSTNT